MNEIAYGSLSRQSLITQLLLSWKYDGYVRWLHGLFDIFSAASML